MSTIGGIMTAPKLGRIAGKSLISSHTFIEVKWEHGVKGKISAVNGDINIYMYIYIHGIEWDDMGYK